MTNAQASSRIRVMQIIDSLNIGGAERMAVNIANELPQDTFESHLCVTRVTGSLEKEVTPNVRLLFLERKHTIDAKAFLKLAQYIRKNRIDIIHAHASSLLIANIAALLAPSVKLIWHDHYGWVVERPRNPFLFRLATTRARYVIDASTALQKWTLEEVGVSPERAQFIPNFVSPPRDGMRLNRPLPGQDGFRIVCVANLRPQKDHPTLIDAMRMIVNKEPRAHLLLVGSGNSSEYRMQLEKQVSDMKLSNHITFLGMRNDIAAILNASNIGVISSSSEAMPLAIIEYGYAKLATVSTSVGDCPFLLDEGSAGKLVPPRSPEEFADAVLAFLNDPHSRQEYGERLHQHVHDNFGVNTIIGRITEIYRRALNR